ncbi:MAG: LUD domain-containing protein [Stappiaceae bacterium]
MGSKSTIMNKVRSSLSVNGGDADRKKAVAKRLNKPPQGIIPKRGQLNEDARRDLFIEMAERVQATTDRVNSADDVPTAVANYLRNHNLEQIIHVGSDPRVSAMPWDKAPQLEVLDDICTRADSVTLTHAFAGVAESGTAIMTSGPDNPTSNNFLPQTHIVVLNAPDIKGDYESVWQRLRTVHGKGTMPRTVNMITGPSRSADIEQTLILGAHGPRALHVIVVG